MNTNYFENWNKITQKIQVPLLALSQLNIETLQGFSYLKPEELIQAKKPEEILEKQISLAVENGHKTLDYLKKSFHIFEKAMKNFP